MTNDEIEKTMQFILDQQSKQAEYNTRQAEYNTRVDKKIEFILDQQALHESSIQEMREVMVSLAKTVEKANIQAEEDRQEMREGFTEMRHAMEALIGNSEDIRNITKQLSTAVIGMNRRVKKIEGKAS